MDNEQYKEIMKRLEFIEFRQQLLFDDDEVSRLLFEYRVTQGQYRAIMNLMDDYRDKIEKGQKVYSADFEAQVKRICPDPIVDYHFCEYIALAFRNEHRWEEVFEALYGGSSKYAYLKRQ